MPTVVIQHIETVWTKLSRGGDRARNRNAVPDAIHLPAFPDDSRFALHHATFHEHSAFTQHNRSLATNTFADLGLNFISLMIDDAMLAVRFHRDENNAATPSPFPHKDPFALQSAEWGRIVYNGRFSAWNTGIWWYTKHVYNIGWFDKWDSGVFLNIAPRSEFREMARLR